jgi:hypothetical protein
VVSRIIPVSCWLDHSLALSDTMHEGAMRQQQKHADASILFSFDSLQQCFVRMFSFDRISIFSFRFVVVIRMMMEMIMSMNHVKCEP